MSTKKPRKRDWNRIKGRRPKGERIPVLVNTPNECVLVYGRRKLSFTCDVPLDQPLMWESIQGKVVDERLLPEFPQRLERMRPLRAPTPAQMQAAKARAFALLKKKREEALQKNRQLSFCF